MSTIIMHRPTEGRLIGVWLGNDGRQRFSARDLARSIYLSRWIERKSRGDRDELRT